MYIGPWQEYKLARLIQNQQNQIHALQAGIAPSPGRLRLTPGSRRHGSAQSERIDDDSESTATSSFSSKSAPVLGAPGGGPRSGAQRRLEEYYQDDERERRREDKEARNRHRPPRPNSGIRIGGRLPSEVREASVKKRADNFARARNSRIHGMRALYGLGSNSRPSSSPHNSDGASEATPSPSHSQLGVSPARSQGSNSVLSAASGLGGYGRAIAPPLHGDQMQAATSSTAVTASENRSALSENTARQKPLWLSQHQSATEKLQTPSTTSRSTAASSACSAAPVAQVRSSKPNRDSQSTHVRLSPTLEEAFDKIQTSMDFQDDFPDSPMGKKCDDIDPLAMSSMSVQSNASNDLINWSKNLRPEDLSPEATLASFFKL